jgi:pyruvate dehydrogenase E2 component (dihydrolipoamide acetyltransferase)
MATPVIMPRQGQSVESCLIAKWHKQKGDKVKTGELLFSYETDKAAFDEEAKIDGTMLEIFFGEGDDVPVLTNVCVIGNEGENTAEFNPKAQSATSSKSETVLPNAGSAPVAETVASVPGPPVHLNEAEKIKISPRAQNLAAKTGVDYRYANPTGPYGRIIERDILALRETGPVVTASAKEDYLKSPVQSMVAGTGLGGRITTGDLKAPASPAKQIGGPEFEEVKLSNIRKLIAKAMHNSISSTAQLTLNTSFDATDILAFRKKIKENKDRLGLENITINDLVLYAVSRTLLNHRPLNAHFYDDKMLHFKNVHLGVAVDTERGLMVPTIFNANLRSLNEIAAEMKKLASECQKGTINPDLLQGATFTLTNLGTFEIESFTPVLNPPQTGILGINTIVQRAREVDGEYVFYPAIGLSLTFDHRALDGAPVARFLQELKNNLETFSLLLAKF